MYVRLQDRPEERFRQGLEKADLQMRVPSWRCLCLMLYLSGGT